MQFFNITRILLETIAVIVSAAAVPSLDQPAVADQSAAAPTIVPQQPSLDDLFQGFGDRMALDQRLQRLEQQIQTLLNMQSRFCQIPANALFRPAPKHSPSPGCDPSRQLQNTAIAVGMKLTEPLSPGKQ
jgi:hypothetical protein